MINGGFLEEPEGESAEEKGWKHEFRSAEDEDASDEQEKGRSADEKLGSGFTEEDGKGKDTVSAVALDVFEVLDGKYQGVGNEEKEEEWFRKSL